MERLYNNITLPDSWPPHYREETLDKPLRVPYLENKPDYIDISVGRQLFVDDFLICETDLIREFGKPQVSEKPVLWPQTSMELNDGYCTCACPFNGGVFYDAQSRKYKMWYHAGWFDGSAYAESDDGFRWKRLSQISTGHSDRVLKHIPGYMRDGDAVWLDEYAGTPDERYKMLVFYRCFEEDYKYYHRKPKHAHDDPASVPPKEITVLYKSADGIYWEEVGTTSHSGDNTTFFYNPFRKKWIYSMRTFSELDSRVRVRSYYETDDFYKGSRWSTDDLSFWARTDIYDKPDRDLGYYTQLYNLDAVAYESVMLGIYSVFMGPPNFVCEKTRLPKINDLKIAFSRDGFHFDRPTYEDFLSSSRKEGSWDYGYLHPANGICTVAGDELYFYYSAFSGNSPHFGSHKYSGGAVGVAKLRRDGFAGMKAFHSKGSLTTEILKYQGEFLFVNADCTGGKLSAEILDPEGNVIPGYSGQDCIVMTEDKTKYRITWQDKKSLKDVRQDKIRIRFTLDHATIYAFWITDSEEGKSHGYLAAGSLELKAGNKDD
jgi:hypothetical protein